MQWTDEEIENYIRQARVKWYGPGAENLIITHEDCALVRLGAQFSAESIDYLPFSYRSNDSAKTVVEHILKQAHNFLIEISKDP